MQGLEITEKPVVMDTKRECEVHWITLEPFISNKVVSCVNNATPVTYGITTKVRQGP